jgi:hypothetical protein
MRRFVIERALPGIGGCGPAELRRAAERSNRVLAELGGKEIQWVESYVAADRLFCVFLAVDDEILRIHAARSGFPATRIHEVLRMLDPTSAAAPAELRV